MRTQNNCQRTGFSSLLDTISENLRKKSVCLIQTDFSTCLEKEVQTALMFSCYLL